MNKIAFFLILMLSSTIYSLSSNAQGDRTTLYVNGRYLYTPCNEKVIIRGVNKMIVWTNDLNLRWNSYAEIRKTGANCVRIVWLANPGQSEVDAGPDGLDRTIQYCIDNKMIPMVELHDATGYWPGLQQCVDYWISPAVLSVIKSHEKYLLLNIANECGNDQVSDAMFKAGYENAINQIRAAGIKCPLVIDAGDWGKNLGQLRNTGNYLLNIDSEHNLLFSVHMYWAVSDGANSAFINREMQDAVDLNLPFIVGEFSHLFNRGKECVNETDYNAIIQLCQEKEIGWLAWEWGPGNEYADPSCDIMNMTTDSYFNTLKNTWAKIVAETSPYSIKNTSVTSNYIMNGGKCEVSSVDEIASNEIQLNANPNPFSENTIITINIPVSCNASIMVYNSLGKQVYSIADTHYDKGIYNFNINIRKSEYQGVYYCVYSDGTQTRSIMLNLLK